VLVIQAKKASYKMMGYWGYSERWLRLLFMVVVFLIFIIFTIL